jgi:hypothetical protein
MRHVERTHTNDLALADTEVSTAISDWAVKRKTVLLRVYLKREQAGSAKRVVQLSVVVSIEHVQILAKSARQELGLIKNVSRDRDHKRVYAQLAG